MILVVRKTDAGLVVNLQCTVGYRLAQIHFQDAACLYLRVHVRLEETIGPASGGFCGIHRQIRILEDLIEIAAVLRRQGDADAGVGGHLVTETFVGLPDRLENPARQGSDVGGSFDRGLDDGEFVTSQPRDKVGGRDAPAQAHGDRFQQLVADQMSKRIVDALEFVDVDVEHRQLLAPRDASQLLLQLFVEQSPVRQVGQRVVMRQMPDLLLGEPALGDVLMCRHPSAIRQRFVRDLD